MFLQPFKKMRKSLKLCLENMKSFKHFHWIRGFKDNGNLVFNIYFGKRLSLVFQGSKLADLYHSPYKMFFMMLGQSRCKCTNYKSLTIGKKFGIKITWDNHQKIMWFYSYLFPYTIGCSICYLRYCNLGLKN